MAKVYKTALGKQIDVDHLALTNEHVIALGNMRTNARGDELGPGGKIVKTRDQLMKEYYALNTPVAADPIQPPINPSPVARSVQQEPIREVQGLPPMAQPVVNAREYVPTPIAADPAVYNPASGLDEVEEDPIVPERKVIHIDVGNTTTEQTAEIVQQVATIVKEASVANIAAEMSHLTSLVTEQPEIRGSLASSVAKTATITQVEKLPPKKSGGVQRI